MNRQKRNADRAKTQAKNKHQEVQDLEKDLDLVMQITSFKDRLVQKRSTLITADSFCHTHFFMRLQVTQMSRSEE